MSQEILVLSVLNRHPRDSRISFEEVEHIYTVDGEQCSISATGFVKKFFNAFDADKVLEKLNRFGVMNKKWPGMSISEIKDEWSEKGRIAATRGTKLHRYIELFYNAVDITTLEEVNKHSELDIEIEMFYKFVQQLPPEYIPYRTEWFIFYEKYSLAGSIDMVFQVDPKSPRKIAIYDWKCSKEIKKKNKYEKTKEPLSHLDDCNYNHYALQLNLYKHILEKKYDYQVVEMVLVILHRNFEDYQLIKLPDMQSEIISMFESRN